MGFAGDFARRDAVCGVSIFGRIGGAMVSGLSRVGVGRKLV